MYFMIAGWGYEDRQRAALMFFIYTLLGSLPLLLAIIGLYLSSGTFDMRVWIDMPPLTGIAAMHAPWLNPRIPSNGPRRDLPSESARLATDSSPPRQCLLEGSRAAVFARPYTCGGSGNAVFSV